MPTMTYAPANTSSATSSSSSGNSTSSGRLRGVVKWFSDEKGYGFVEPAARGADVFVHYSGIRGKGHKKLVEGDEVEYTLEQTAKGLQAVDVVLIEPAAE